MRFVKMHGIGNDYVYVNGFEETIHDPAGLAARIADRHFGVGGDGLILVLPPSAGVDAHVRMRIFNADGSEAEMCGNGIRCVCKLSHDCGISNANPMRVETGRGVLSLTYTLDSTGKVDQVTVDMGQPILTPSLVPVDISGVPKVVDYPIRGRGGELPGIDWPHDLPADWIAACGLDERMTCVSMGNPHAIFYCRDVSRIPLEQVGPGVEWHRLFPRRINVHFVQVHSPREVTMRTWERGSGITLACGTGAAAVCVAGVLTGRGDRQLLAHLPGGDLQLEWRQSDQHVYMTGPARQVFTGQWCEPV